MRQRPGQMPSRTEAKPAGAQPADANAAAAKPADPNAKAADAPATPADPKAQKKKKKDKKVKPEPRPRIRRHGNTGNHYACDQLRPTSLPGQPKIRPASPDEPHPAGGR